MRPSPAYEDFKGKLAPDPASKSSYSPINMSAAREQVLSVLIAATIGVSSGLAVVWLHMVIEWARLLLHGRWFNGPRIILVPAIGGFLAALVLQKVSRACDSGIIATKASLYLNNGYVPLRTTLAQFLSSALAIGCGHPLGPEDPLLHVGAGLGSFLARTLRLPREHLARLAPVAAAAGLAGALNAPLAGVLLIIEVVIGSWTSPAQVGLMVVGSLSSVAVVRHFLGSRPLLQLPPIHIGGLRETLSYMLIGLAASMAGLLLVRLIRLLKAQVVSLPEWTYSLQVAMAGIAVGIAAFAGLPEVMGAGYNALPQVMLGQFGWKVLLLLAGVKLVLTAMSFAAKTPGGIIAPTLFIGAIFGCIVAGMGHSLSGDVAGSMVAFVLLGMSALLATVLRCPLASVFLAVEFSGSDSIILPAIVVVGTAWLLAIGLQRRSLVEVLMDFDRMHLPEPSGQKAGPLLQVKDAMQPPDFPVVNSSATLRDAWRKVAEESGDLIFVRHSDASWTTIERSLLDRLEATSDPQERLQDVLGESPMPRLYPDLPLDTTLRHLHRWPVLPVVDRADVSILLGVITMDAVMRRYCASEESSESLMPEQLMETRAAV